MNIPKDLKYAQTHEWVSLEDDIATVGITDFAQSQLGDLTFVELPAVDDEFTVESESAVVESVKAASDIYAPMSGVVVEVNETLIDEPELVNNDPFGEGWLYKLKVSDVSELDQLMSADEYEEQLPVD